MEQIDKNHPYTFSEVKKRLDGLTEADITRLLQAYSVMGCEARAGLASRDVLHEVCRKALALDRVWPRHLEAVPYLIESGHSEISNEVKKYSRHVFTESDQMEGEGGIHPLALAHPSPEAKLAQYQSETQLADWIKKIQDLFANDGDATCYITQKLAEMKKAAILLACRFTDPIYRNVEKRIKDKIRKRFPKGFPWWELSE